jgi:hypothetical protein
MPRPFTLFDKIFNFGFTYDDELAVPQPATGRADALVKRDETSQLLEDVLGSDFLDTLKVAQPPAPVVATAAALNACIAQVCHKAARNYLEKFCRLSAGVPKRQQDIEQITRGFRQTLIDKGFSADDWDGWPTLQLHPALKDYKERLRLLAEFRNSAIHLGEIVDKERKEIFHEFLAATALLADEMKISRKDCFGEFEDLVATHLSKADSELNRLTAEKLARAKANYDKKYGLLARNHLHSIITSFENAYEIRQYEDQLAACPACENQGLLGGSIDVAWEADYDEGQIVGASPVVTFIPSNFTCDLCGLSLNGSTELRAAGLGESILVKDVDPSDFYDEPSDESYYS